MAQDAQQQVDPKQLMQVMQMQAQVQMLEALKAKVKISRIF